MQHLKEPSHRQREELAALRVRTVVGGVRHAEARDGEILGAVMDREVRCHGQEGALPEAGETRSDLCSDRAELGADRLARDRAPRRGEASLPHAEEADQDLTGRGYLGWGRVGFGARLDRPRPSTRAEPADREELQPLSARRTVIVRSAT